MANPKEKTVLMAKIRRLRISVCKCLLLEGLTYHPHLQYLVLHLARLRYLAGMSAAKVAVVTTGNPEANDSHVICSERAGFVGADGGGSAHCLGRTQVAHQVIVR